VADATISDLLIILFPCCRLRDPEIESPALVRKVGSLGDERCKTQVGVWIKCAPSGRRNGAKMMQFLALDRQTADSLNNSLRIA
jgi:hypothetical protein